MENIGNRVLYEAVEMHCGIAKFVTSFQASSERLSENACIVKSSVHDLFTEY